MKLFKNKYFILGNMILLLITIPVILFFLKNQTQTGTHAAATTQLTLTSGGSATINASANTPFTVDVTVNPNQNIVSIINMYILYDQTKLQLTSITPNDSAFPVTLRGPTIASGSGNISLNTGADVTRAIQTPTKVATLTFTPLANTTSSGTNVSFDPTQTKVFSLNPSDQPGENVLQSITPATVIVGTAPAVTSTPTPPVTTQAVTPTPTVASALPQAPPPGKQSSISPVCNSLSVDRSVTGVAPYSLVFTGNGSGTNPIQKATFTYGDGAVDNVTSAGGIGTTQVNLPVAHTYNNVGTYTATVAFTDSNNLVSSSSANCTQTIAVSAQTQAPVVAGGTSGGTGNGTTPQPTIPATGDITTTFGIIGGIVVAIAGGVALLLL